VIQVQARIACLAGLLHPDPDLLRRPLQRLGHRSHRAIVAEQQAGRPQGGELPQRGQRDLQIEVRRRRRGPEVPGIRYVHPRGIADIQVAALRIDQAHVVFGVPG
jgi:hypothetical protein